jgi:hypothetical protein
MSQSVAGPQPTRNHAPAPYPSIALRFGIGLCLALLLGYIWLAVTTVQKAGGTDAYVRKSDFLSTVTGAAILAQRPTALYDETAQARAQGALLRAGALTPLQLLPYIHPPVEALLILPLWEAGAGLDAMLCLWTLLSVAALATSLAALRWAWPASGPRGLLALLAALSFFPGVVSLLLGQNTTIVLMGWAAGSALLRCGRSSAAGAALAVSILRPQTLPVILLALVLMRAWRALAAWAATVGLGALLVTPFLGLDWPVRYVSFLLRIAAWPPNAAIDPRTMQNWRGLFERLLGPGLPGTALTTVASLLSLALVVAGWWALRRTEPGGVRLGAASSDWWWSAVLLVAILVSPHVQPHDLTLALVPAWILTAQAMQGGDRRLAAWLWLGWLCGFVAAVAATWSAAPAVLWLAITALGLLSRQLRSSAATAGAQLTQVMPADQHA